MTTRASARALAVLGLALAPSVAFAGNILYCNDYVLGTDHLGNALSSLSALHTTTSTTSISSCESQVASGGWDLVVLAIQNQSYSTPNFNSYVSSGGLAILQDWTRDSSRGAAAGVSYGSTNSSSMTISYAPIASGLSSTTQTFTNPGWGIYTMGMGGAGLTAATFSSGQVAIAINSGNTVIVNGFLTDTITNAADAQQLYVNEVEFLLGSCDEDGDGYDATGACGGSDCDDTDPSINPGASEYCNGIDDDCDGTIDEDSAVDATDWYADADSDGFGSPSVVDTACYQPSGYVADNTDCDDTVATTYPGADEYCNGVDDDCDGTIDEDAALDVATWYADTDSDGFGDPSSSDIDCSQPSGFVADNTDCDDTVATTYPGADEYCNGVDDDCDGTVDEDAAVDATNWYADADSDGFGDPSVVDTECYQPSGYVTDNTDCDDTVATTYPGADEYCNSVDDDCDGTIDEDTALDASDWYADADSDGFGDPSVVDTECYQPSGYVTDNTDCDDTVATTYPGADEYCNGVDDDCDGTIDEDTALDARTWFRDADSDGFGDAAVSDDECEPPSGYVADDTDCDDADPASYPGAPEVPYDGIDQDCDGSDECDSDADGYDAEECDGDDCDDQDAEINPGASETWYDGIDGDCDDASDYDADSDTFDSASYGGEDCDDADAGTYPGAPDEPGDGVVNDCDDSDEYDRDGDGFDDEAYGGSDCDDANSDINPEASETWYNGVDEDCDGNDDDQDGDGFRIDDDCDDTDAESYPGNGELGDDCEALDADSDTGGLDGRDIGAATGGGGLKGCSDTKAAGLAGAALLFAIGLRRRRDD